MGDDPVLAALGRIEAKIAQLQEGQTWLRTDLSERMDLLQQQVDALLTAGPGRAEEAQARAAAERNREQIRILMDLFRKLDSRVRQLEEKR